MCCRLPVACRPSPQPECSERHRARFPTRRVFHPGRTLLPAGGRRDRGVRGRLGARPPAICGPCCWRASTSLRRSPVLIAAPICASVHRLRNGWCVGMPQTEAHRRAYRFPASGIRILQTLENVARVTATGQTPVVRGCSPGRLELTQSGPKPTVVDRQQSAMKGHSALLSGAIVIAICARSYAARPIVPRTSESASLISTVASLRMVATLLLRTIAR